MRLVFIFIFSFLCIANIDAQKKDSAKMQAKKTAANSTSKPATKQTTTQKPAATKTTAPGTTTQKQPTTPKKSDTKQPAKTTATNTNRSVAKPAAKVTTTKQPVVKTPAPAKPAQKRDSTLAKKKVVPAKPVVKKDSTSTNPIVKKPAPMKKDTTAPVAAPLSPADSIKIKEALADSLKKEQQYAELLRNFNLTQGILSHHPYFTFVREPVISPYVKRKKKPGKEVYFYTLAGLMLLFAGFRTTFSKYFDDLTTLFFRRTLKQNQLQQQLSQNTLPSFLFNILFVLIAGFYLALMVEQLGLGGQAYPFWQLFSFAAILVAAAYLAKFFLLKLCGWLFNLKNFTDAYIFLIFLINKILIMFLLPVIVITALGGTEIKTIIWTLSWMIIGALYLYRFVVAVQMVQKSNKISLFHFSIYFIALELLPTFVIYKLILLFLS